MTLARRGMQFLNGVHALFAAIGILLLTLVVSLYVDVQGSTLQAERLRANVGLEHMVRLSQELTNMLLVAVLDQNLLRTASYDTVKDELDGTILTMIDLTQKLRSSSEIRVLRDSHEQRKAFEQNLIELMRADKWSEARGILFGDDYVLARKTNEIDIESAVSAVSGELDAAAGRFNRIVNVMLFLRIGTVVLLAWVGIAFSRRTRTDLNEQIRLRTELSTANEELERRVKQRTAALEERTLELASENEERMRSEARTSLILKSAGEGMFGMDAQGLATFFNDTAATLLRFTAEEMIGKEIHALIHHSHADGTPYPEEDCPMFRACRHGEAKNVTEEVIWRKDGTSFPTEYSATPIFDERAAASGAVIVFRDVSERRKNEEELKSRLEELERFNRLTVSRELRMIELKGEINTALEALGKEKKYKIVE